MSVSCPRGIFTKQTDTDITICSRRIWYFSFFFLTFAYSKTNQLISQWLQASSTTCLVPGASLMPVGTDEWHTIMMEDVWWLKEDVKKGFLRESFEPTSFLSQHLQHIHHLHRQRGHCEEQGPIPRRCCWNSVLQLQFSQSPALPYRYQSSLG